MSPKRRFLKLEVTASDSFGDVVRVKVLEQTHTGDEFAFVPAHELEDDEEFGPDVTMDEFVASNGYILCSCGCPEWVEQNKRLYVQGEDDEGNNDVIEIPTEHVIHLITAVSEYNEVHSMGAQDGKAPSPEPEFLQIVRFVVQ